MYPAFEDKKTTVEIKNPQTGEIEKLQYDITDWRKLDLESVIFTPIPYSVDFFDKENNDYVSPKEGIELYVVSNGVHADICLPLITGDDFWNNSFDIKRFATLKGSPKYISFGCKFTLY